MSKTPHLFAFALVACLGFIIGNGIYGLYNANTLSYLSNDSASCNNCHVMNEVHSDWAKSSHKGVECIECHLPHSFARKWVAKAYTGLDHAYHFTFDKHLPAHFSANADTKAWVKENCMRCHADYAHNAIDPTKGSKQNKGDNSLDCMSCHHSVGHLRDF